MFKKKKTQIGDIYIYICIFSFILLFIHLFIYPCICIFIYLFIYLCIYLRVLYLFIYLFFLKFNMCLSSLFIYLYLLICLSIYPSIYLSIHLSIYLLISLFIYLSINLFFYLSMCVMICKYNSIIYMNNDVCIPEKRKCDDNPFAAGCVLGAPPMRRTPITATARSWQSSCRRSGRDIPRPFRWPATPWKKEAGITGFTCGAFQKWGYPKMVLL